jgi:hypothetical protein
VLFLSVHYKIPQDQWNRSLIGQRELDGLAPLTLNPLVEANTLRKEAWQRGPYYHKQASLTDLLLTVLTLSLSPRDGPITLFLSVHKG